jgi:glycine dehydrogenase subunit 1
MTVYGKEGLRELALQNLSKAHYLGGKLKRRFSGPYFNEFVAHGTGDMNRALESKKIIGGLSLDGFYPELKDTVLLCCTETSRRSEMDEVALTFAPVSGQSVE